MINNNADIVKGNVYTWNINKNNHENKSIIFQFSKKEKDRIIEENYEAVLSQYPSTVSNEQKKQIHSSVEETVTKKLQTINKQINTAIQKIKTYAKKRYTKAFTKLYQYSIVFVALSTFSFLLFPKKGMSK